MINGILARNSIASPQLVDYRFQSAILGITSPSDFLAALGPNPCQRYTDPTENQFCLDLLANSQFVATSKATSARMKLDVWQWDVARM